MPGLCQLKAFEVASSTTTNRHVSHAYIDHFVEDFIEIDDLIGPEPTEQDNVHGHFIEIGDLIDPEPTQQDNVDEHFIEIDDLIGPEPTQQDNVDEHFMEIDDLIGPEPTQQDNVDEHFIAINDLIGPEPTQQNNVDELWIEDADGMCELYLFEDVSMFLLDVGNAEAAEPASQTYCSNLENGLEARNIQLNGVQPCFILNRSASSHLLQTNESAYLY